MNNNKYGGCELKDIEAFLWIGWVVLEVGKGHINNDKL
jgi:hypothetical protein